MKITLVQVIKTHAWTKGLKGYVFAVTVHEDPNTRTKKQKEHDAKFWQVVHADYAYSPTGLKPSRVRSPYLLQKTHVLVIGSMEVEPRKRRVKA